MDSSSSINGNQSSFSANANANANYTGIGQLGNSSSSSSQSTIGRIFTSPNLAGNSIGPSGTSLGNWVTYDSSASNDFFYSRAPRYHYLLDIGPIAEDLGFTHCVEGLDNSVLLTSEQDTIVKLWCNEEDSIEKFFVLGAINGCLDLETVIAITEVSLNDLVGKSFYKAIEEATGMSKWFFKIIERTPYLDEWVLDQKFLRYWIRRLQNFQNNSEACDIVRYMLKILLEKKAELVNSEK